MYASDLLETRGATFSECGRYRYRLDRAWDADRRPLIFGMLNPSTADAERNDPTIERCLRRARRDGYGSMVVWNLFAFRATRPSDLISAEDPIGPENDKAISDVVEEALERNGTVVVAWGNHGALLDRGMSVARHLRKAGVELKCLGLTSAGQPRHPLYVPYENAFVDWIPA